MKKLTALMLAILILMLPACSDDKAAVKETTVVTTTAEQTTTTTEVAPTVTTEVPTTAETTVSTVTTTPTQTLPPVTTTTAATTQPVVEPNLMTAEFTTDATLAGGNYHRYDSGSRYRCIVTFYAHDKLTNIVLSCGSDVIENSFYEVYRLAELTPDKPLVADIVLPGDTSACIISFTTPKGNIQKYTVSTSLMDGSLCFGRTTKNSPL